MKVFVDADVVIDLITRRHPHSEAAAAVFHRFESGQAEGFVSALTFAHVAYFVKNSSGPEHVQMAVQELRLFVKPLPVETRTIDLALKRNGRDFEDEVQAACAELAEMDCIVTRNGKDFVSTKLPVYDPQSFLKRS